MNAMRSELSTDFVSRLRARDPAAWFELWETFGPILGAQLRKWGRGRIGVETVKDLSQETMAALANGIDRHDPSKGARFSTWLLAIAKYTLRRRDGPPHGQVSVAVAKRPGRASRRSGQGADTSASDRTQSYESRWCSTAKVEAAIRMDRARERLRRTSRSIRMRVLRGARRARPSRPRRCAISEADGHAASLAKVRERLRGHIWPSFVAKLQLHRGRKTDEAAPKRADPESHQG